MAQETREAGKSLRLDLQFAEVRNANDIETIIGGFKTQRVHAVNVLSSATFNANRKRIVTQIATNKLPAIYPTPLFVEEGGFMTYGVNLNDVYRRAAIYVDKILKGAKPADLPVEQPTKFEFIINLKAAKQIGLTIPPNVLARADRVIR
jgi:putative ABC transport system substrate-binding protein